MIARGALVHRRGQPKLAGRVSIVGQPLAAVPSVTVMWDRGAEERVPVAELVVIRPPPRGYKTWRDRALDLVGTIIRDAMDPNDEAGDVERAIARLKDTVRPFGPVSYPTAIWNEERKAAIARLVAGVQPTKAGPCSTCGAGGGQGCKPINGEIEPGEMHAARSAT